MSVVRMVNYSPSQHDETSRRLHMTSCCRRNSVLRQEHGPTFPLDTGCSVNTVHCPKAAGDKHILAVDGYTTRPHFETYTIDKLASPATIGNTSIVHLTRDEVVRRPCFLIYSLSSSMLGDRGRLQTQPHSCPLHDTSRHVTLRRKRHSEHRPSGNVGGWQMHPGIMWGQNETCPSGHK